VFVTATLIGIQIDRRSGVGFRTVEWQTIAHAFIENAFMQPLCKVMKSAYGTKRTLIFVQLRSAFDQKQIFSPGVRPISGLGFFTKTFDIGFRLIWCLVDVLADLGNALVLSRRLYVDDETRSVGSADDPPIRESRITSGDEKNGCQKNPMQH
jgi:hypothetical protein